MSDAVLSQRLESLQDISAVSYVPQFTSLPLVIVTNVGETAVSPISKEEQQLETALERLKLAINTALQEIDPFEVFELRPLISYSAIGRVVKVERARFRFVADADED